MYPCTAAAASGGLHKRSLVWPHKNSFVWPQEILCVATQDILCVATQEICRVVTQDILCVAIQEISRPPRQEDSCVRPHKSFLVWPIERLRVLLCGHTRDLSCGHTGDLLCGHTRDVLCGHTRDLVLLCRGRGWGAYPFLFPGTKCLLLRPMVTHYTLEGGWGDKVLFSRLAVSTSAERLS